jgi:gamma-glutamylcyclotransferase (GGCT)/AIG2-like uncharacterized protein YtfP
LTESTGLYFAYGSNLRTTRMVQRVPSAVTVGAARLAGHELRIDKRGRDGSAKANLAAAPGEHVWGVIYRIGPTDWPVLDRFEGGYVRCSIVVELNGAAAGATTYQSDQRVPGLLAFDWYLAHLCSGAREHALPGDWCARLEALSGLAGTEGA